jgi:hypothetical protein
MANSDSSDTGVGINRQSLVTSLEERYNGWKGSKEREAPTAVDFLSNNYVEGFKMNKQAGSASDIRSIGLGGPGAKSLYSEEKGLPSAVNFLTDLYQSQFIKNMQVRNTSFKGNALNYVDGIPGFSNKKYFTGGIQ